MGVNRKHWRPPFSKLPSWLCPECQSGTLALNGDSLKCEETGPSREAHDHEAWDPDWTVERFSGLLTCQNSSCGEIVAIGGKISYVEDHDWEQQQHHWAQVFHPTFISPAPPIFALPDKCPEAVVDELSRAFALFWFDTGSCANRMRTAAEALLTDRRVPSTTINRMGSRARLSLHARIERFKQTAPDSADYLLAIKWLGNAGSHANLDELSRDDLLNGFELFEHVVERIYVKREEHLKKIAKGINSRKGKPVKKRNSASFI